MSNPAETRVAPIELRWATEDDYREVAYQVGTLYRAARTEPPEAAANALQPSRKPKQSDC